MRIPCLWIRAVYNIDIERKQNMKRLIAFALVLMLSTGTAFATSFRLKSGAVTIPADGAELTLEAFHILGIDPDGNYLLFDGEEFYSVTPSDLEQAVSIDESFPELGVLETLSQGTRGETVVPLQEGLIDLGFLEGSADGDFGPGTSKAVRAFQEAFNLEATGKADEITRLLIASMAGETIDIEGMNPETMYAPIMGRTTVDIQPILESGLLLSYSEMDGEGFISDGKINSYDASGSTDLDKYVLSYQFGFLVREERDAVEVLPAIKVSCLCVRRPVLTEVMLKAGGVKGSAPIEDLQVKLSGVDTVEEGIALLSDEMVEALSQAKEGLSMRIVGQYNSFDINVDNNVDLIGQIALEMK